MRWEPYDLRRLRSVGILSRIRWVCRSVSSSYEVICRWWYVQERIWFCRMMFAIVRRGICGELWETLIVEIMKMFEQITSKNWKRNKKSLQKPKNTSFGIKTNIFVKITVKKYAYLQKKVYLCSVQIKIVLPIKIQWNIFFLWFYCLL